jgi:hypothetical protein
MCFAVGLTKKKMGRRKDGGARQGRVGLAFGGHWLRCLKGGSELGRPLDAGLENVSISIARYGRSRRG